MMILAAAVAAALPAAGVAAGDTRVAALNWGLAQTLIALDIEPVAVAGADGYREWVREPPLPQATVGLGRRAAPNLDVLAGAQPDLIVMSGHTQRPVGQFETIAPIEHFAIFTDEHEPLRRNREVAQRLAQRLGAETAFERLGQRLDQTLTDLRRSAASTESVYIVQFRDAGHVRVFGENSLFGNVLARTPLRNAWQGQTNAWGFSQVPIHRLDADADHLIVIAPIQSRARAMMDTSPIWAALPAVESGQVHRLPPVWAFGGIPAAIRFARLLTERLDDRD